MRCWRLPTTIIIHTARTGGKLSSTGNNRSSTNVVMYTDSLRRSEPNLEPGHPQLYPWLNRELFQFYKVCAQTAISSTTGRGIPHGGCRCFVVVVVVVRPAGCLFSISEHRPVTAGAHLRPRAVFLTNYADPLCGDEMSHRNGDDVLIY